MGNSARDHTPCIHVPPCEIRSSMMHVSATRVQQILSRSRLYSLHINVIPTQATLTSPSLPRAANRSIPCYQLTLQATVLSIHPPLTHLSVKRNVILLSVL